jgi:mersacidin/lichenicidin family type 2 lantibiotic
MQVDRSRGIWSNTGGGVSHMAVDIARAWKDPEYRKTLTPEELASLPGNPAGAAELSQADLDRVSGGAHLTWKPESVS